MIEYMKPNYADYHGTVSLPNASKTRISVTVPDSFVNALTERPPS